MEHSDLVRQVLKDPLHWPAFGFGLGLMPFAPGTWGSLLGIALWWATPRDPVVQLSLAAAMFLAGIWITGASARRIGVHDHPGIVWDEILGMYLTLVVVPPKPLWILAAFGFFRVADIWKPWPIRDLDHRLGGGLGIMLDDVIAALYAAVMLLFLQYFLI
ncbi:MAG: phosphatidylglycerophosphatase A [Gammaproteobacteria bacterium]|nr:phosphatidylglycerophosphatase A [Gammaproteobacteria bacterium]MDP7092980.1 phosphatidylglycerophosphatase A [Gammaproteobacteria bacterium]MDP7271082.1 phosphatidylglycerophosphatase A [Gammaproteobacteria bacterium]HJP04414.1 phosphatidylglycerophosphatase A [Gammaproteobacteria bacterium]